MTVYTYCLGSGLVLGLRMNLSLQQGSEGTAVQPRGKENLRASLRTLSCEASWGEAWADSVSRTRGTELPLTRGVLWAEVPTEPSENVDVGCSAQTGRLAGTRHSLRDPGALAPLGEADREMGGSLRPTWFCSPFWDSPPHLTPPWAGPVQDLGRS